VAAILLVTLAGCGDSDSTAGGPTTTRPWGSPLTADDSSRLARMLFLNFTDGGAAVSVSFDYSVDLSVQMVGVVDWTGHAGELVVTTSFADGRPPDRQDVVFTEDAVYEAATPDDVAAFAAAGRPGVAWLMRPPDRAGRPVDQVIGLLVSLAATRPDNPQLLAQGETSFDRRDEVGGAPADVYVTKAGASYWVSVTDDRLVRFEGQLDGFAGPVTLDLTTPGSQSVAVPVGSIVAPSPEAPPG
jgi:hypothetical protein